MKGFRSILIHVGIAAGTAGLGYLANYDWVTHVGPVLSVVILQVIALGMRLITTTPIGQSGSPTS